MRPEPPESEQFDPVEFAADLERARETAAPRGDDAGDNGFQVEPQAERREDPTAEDWTPQELYCVYEPAFPQLVPRLIPHLGHVILFFVLALVALAVGQVLGVYGLEHLHVLGHKSFNALAQLADDDARLSIPIQALSYGLVAVVVIPVFSLLWNEPFGKGVHWSGGTAKQRFLLLALLGLATGFGINLFGAFLPMPKDPLPRIVMPSPDSSFIRRTSAVRSPFTSFVLLHATSFNVFENTTLGSLFIRSATAASCCLAIGVGQYWIISSQVFLPKSRGPSPLAFPATNAFHSASSLRVFAQLMLSFASTKYPSSETWLNTISFRMSFSFPVQLNRSSSPIS